MKSIKEISDAAAVIAGALDGFDPVDAHKAIAAARALCGTAPFFTTNPPPAQWPLIPPGGVQYGTAVANGGVPMFDPTGCAPQNFTVAVGLDNR